MTMKTKILSTESDFSRRYPVKNSIAWSVPNQKYTPRLNVSEQKTQTPLQISASRKPTVCDFRWKTPRSMTSINNTNAMNPAQRSGLPMLAVATGIPSFDSERIAPDAGESWIRVRGFTPRASHGRNTDLGLGVGSHGRKNRRVRYLFPKSTQGFGPARVCAWSDYFR